MESLQGERIVLYKKTEERAIQRWPGNSRHAFVSQSGALTHSPSPVPPYTCVEAQNLSSERIAPTDNMDHHP